MEMMQGNLHATEGGMYMGQQDAMSAMKDGVRTICHNPLIDYNYFPQVQRGYLVRSRRQIVKRKILLID